MKKEFFVVLLLVMFVSSAQAYTGYYKTNPDEMLSIKKAEKPYVAQYTGEVDRRVFMGDMWKNDPEVLVALPKAQPIKEEVIQAQPEVVAQRVIYVVQKPEDEAVKVSYSWCDSNEPGCE